MEKENIFNEVDAAYESLTDYQKMIALSYATIKLKYILDDPDGFSTIDFQTYLISEFNIKFSDVVKIKDAGFSELYEKLQAKENNIHYEFLNLLDSEYGIKETIDSLNEKLKIKKS